MKCIYKMIRLYPVIVNVVLLITLWFPNNSYILYDITGASLYTMILCFIASFPFKLCLWYRVLCISSIFSLIFEWIDVNIMKINNYICIVQIILIAGMVLALISYLYGFYHLYNL